MQVKTPLLVGGSRNQHGTRIARKVVCQKCGRADHINSRPSKTSGTYCRECATQVMGALEVGKRAPRVMRTHKCSNCQQDFELPAAMEPKKDCTCGNCLKGFETWRGSASMSVEDRESMVLEKRPSGLLIRKNNNQ
ncbi:MAG: hypothetical protein V4534_04005 [Myxococcota bacterium]